MNMPLQETEAIHRQIGRNIRSLRQQHGYTQAALAQELGITFQQLQKYEKGQNRLPIERLHCLHRLFDVPYDYFFHDIGDDPAIPDMAMLQRDPLALDVYRLVCAVRDPVMKRRLHDAIKALTA